MYHILHIPSSQILYREYLIASIESKKIQLKFYSTKETERHIKQLLKVITVYNNSLNKSITSAQRIGSGTSITYRCYRKYIITSSILEQGFTDKWGNVIKRNDVTFYGDALPFFHAVGISVDFLRRININRAEFLIIKECP